MRPINFGIMTLFLGETNSYGVKSAIKYDCAHTAEIPVKSMFGLSIKGVFIGVTLYDIR